MALIFMALLGAGAASAQTSLVTAVKDGGGNLKLISWSIQGGRILRLNGEGASAGAVSRIAAVRLGSTSRLATAVRDGGDDLKVILWNVGFNGVITRVPRRAGQAGEVSRIAAAAPATGDRVVTAVRDGSGNLKVIGWKISSLGDVDRAAPDGAAGAVDDTLTAFPPRRLENVISATFLGRNLLATAVRGSGGRLRINTWRIGDNGAVSRLREVSAEAVREVSALALGESRLVTAVSNGNGNLKVIAWDVDAFGNIRRGGQVQAGAATEIAAFQVIGNRIATALRNGAKNLLIITFDVPPGTSPIVRLAEAGAGAVSLLAASVCGDPVGTPVGTVPLQTSVRDGGDDLKIIAWRTNTSATTVGRLGDASAGEVGLISTACFLP